MILVVAAGMPAGGAGAAHPGGRAAIRSTPEERPLRLPRWFWSWARRYLHRGEFARGPVRGATWGWRRLGALSGRSAWARARQLGVDRVRHRADGAGAVGRVVAVRRSERDRTWILVDGIRPVPEASLSAVWIVLRHDRWVVHHPGVRDTAFEPARGGPIRSDLRPAFTEKRCLPQPPPTNARSRIWRSSLRSLVLRVAGARASRGEQRAVLETRFEAA